VSRRFEEFWAIDWSGARGVYRGVAVARCVPDDSAPQLLSPPDGAAHWTRGAVCAALSARFAARARLLVGFDFAFGIAGGGRSMAAASRAALWHRVDRNCRAPDFYAGEFVAAAPAGRFWRRGKRPDDWDPAFRLTDLRCAEAFGATPESVFKLIGPRQVGMAALAGMRLLHALVGAHRGTIEVWPDRVPRASGRIVEIFPTIFRRLGLGTAAKIRTADALAAALSRFGSRAPRLGSDPLSDDATDAIVSAAAMRAIVARDGAAAFAHPRDPRVRREGWIFGVPA
jgi:hypothetical protein